MDEDADPLMRSGAGNNKRRGRGEFCVSGRNRHTRLLLVLVTLGCAVYAVAAPLGAAGETGLPRSWHEYLTPAVIAVVAALLTFSAFFSSCETAFLAIQKPQLRAMREDKKLSSRLVVGMLDDPGRLLTTILVGNMLVNTLIGVMLGTRIKDVFEFSLEVPAPAAYLAAVALTTGALLFFGEITPKVFAVRAQASWARVAVYPLLAADWLLAPLRKGLLRLTDVLFRVTHFHELRAAPYITDDELKSMLGNGEAKGSTEEEGREMIRRILEFHDVQLREIVVPRLDIVAVPEDATVEEALALFRENEYSRMPVYREDLDHITGILVAKDLLPSVMREDLDRQIKTLVRPAHFVPETMSVQDFIKNVQRQRSHLAIVVDEYGGTEGLVTLHDA
ncbi:MAG: hemolysin family protein, partial [Candidatus Hydrogenedentes bacterium]|nr:hemolysin family protein [Candidatus Hydrogenedentota bacterium]